MLTFGVAVVVVSPVIALKSGTVFDLETARIRDFLFSVLLESVLVRGIGPSSISV